MNRFLRALRVLVLGGLIVSQSGCATSESDLDYSRKTIQTNASGDSSYHGWNSVPEESSP